MSQPYDHPLDEQIHDAVAAGTLPGLHGAIVDLGSDRLAEVYVPGQDEAWGRDLGMVAHGPSTLHDLRSVTKSIVGLLYGIALAEGKVPRPDAPLYAQFPQYPDLQQQPGRDQILVSHALSMQMGLEWNEDLPYSDPRNSEIAMELAPDRYRYALEQPIVQAPGQRWIYSGGATALIGKLIADGTGMALDAYAQEKLFRPLGITNVYWHRGDDGVPSPASGLRLSLPDLARIGRLVAKGGSLGDQQIVPADWLASMSRSQVTLNEHVRYGYLWYLSGRQDAPVVFAVGNGGQRLTVEPETGFVMAVTAGQYNNPDAWQTAMTLMFDIAIPAARAHLAK